MVIASIEDLAVVKRILDHLENRTKSPQSASHPVRAPPTSDASWYGVIKCGIVASITITAKSNGKITCKIPQR